MNELKSSPAPQSSTIANASCAPTSTERTRDDGSDTARAAASGTPGADSAFLATADRSRILGADSADVWMLIVSDFQCPFCRIWHEQTYEAIAREYVQPGKVRLARSYALKPGQAHVYNEGDVHSPRREGPTRLIRVEGTNMDRVGRLSYEPA